MIQTVANCFGDWVGKMSIASRDILSGWFTSDRSSQKHYETLTIQRCPLGIANTDEHLSNSASVYKLDFFCGLVRARIWPQFYTQSSPRAKFARKSTE